MSEECLQDVIAAHELLNQTACFLAFGLLWDYRLRLQLGRDQWNRLEGRVFRAQIDKWLDLRLLSVVSDDPLRIDLQLTRKTTDLVLLWNLVNLLEWI